MQDLQKTYQNRKPLHIVPQILKLQNEDPVTIQDPNELTSMIEGFKQKIEDLIAEIYELTVEKEKDRSEHVQRFLNIQEIILQKMRDDHNRYTTEIQRYRTDIQNIQEGTLSDKERFEQEKEREKRNAESSRAAEMIELQKKIEQLNAIYQEQQKQEKLEQSYKSQIDLLKKKYTEAQYKHHDLMNFEEKKQTKQNENVRSRNELSKKDTVKNAHIQAEKNVIEEQKQALARNRQLKESLLQYQKELERLKKEREQVSKMNREVKINASINLEGLEQYKAVGALQIAKIKAYKDKVDSMKNIIAQQVASKGKLIKTVKDKGDARLSQLRRQLQQAKQQLTSKSKHLSSIKQLAETILDQRAQVQQFFLTAMQHVGSQARDVTRDSNTQPKTYKDKVDISELDLADKEKILRTLFTRISMGSKKQLA